jgi:tetratricopeptide (TPR) repeat protein
MTTPDTVNSNRPAAVNPHDGSRLDHAPGVLGRGGADSVFALAGRKAGRVKTGMTTDRFQTDIDDLFDRYRAAPGSHVFAPLADACRKAGMLEEALDICARGVGANPCYASGYVVQGKCLYAAGRAGDALAAFDRVLELDPKNLVALKYLGILHAERGDNARAREYFEHILALDPDDREIRSRIEDVDMAEAHVPQASVRAETLPSLETLDADDEEIVELPDLEDESFEGAPITLGDETVTPDEIATMTLADIYASQGYASRALKIYREVYKRQPGNATLASKIETLEKGVKAALEAARNAVPEEPAQSPSAAQTSPAPVPEKSAPRERAADAAPRSATPPPTGSPIDQTQSYEQFKRWLKASR